FTIWIRILSRSITSNPQIILSNRERTSFPGFQFRSGVNSEHAWIMQARDDGGVGQLWNVVSTSVAVTDVWNNIAITSDGSTVSIYVDDMSTAEDTATNISTTTGNPGETLTMGGPPANIGFDHMTAGVMGLGLHDKLLSESDT
ncbi:MAG: LamG domain-containing protein, partial [Gammaproteobacteria bacterium]|nr:LamG domain-containing protein [Gammaproteobacteria bacterium]NIR93929.1 LamG domain-containing protein [Gammaproteobacteria bacterium]